MIVIVDYGMGNSGSIVNMLKKVGAETVISHETSVLEKASKLILPGVGAFNKAVTSLERLEIVPLLKRKVLEEKTPIMGICLGMQLLADSSEEGEGAGLGLIEGKVSKFKFESGQSQLKIPHMGWNYAKTCKPSLIFKDMDKQSRFYFVHSYHFVCKNNEDELSRTSYGCEFTSAIQKGNVIGVQFHPEKSHKYGKRLLENFVRFC